MESFSSVRTMRGLSLSGVFRRNNGDDRLSALLGSAGWLGLGDLKIRKSFVLRLLNSCKVVLYPPVVVTR